MDANTPSSTVLWSRCNRKDIVDNSSSVDPEDDVDIDDEALIRAYERSRRLALNKLRKAEAESANFRKPLKSVLKNKSDVPKFHSSDPAISSNVENFKVGDKCLAVFEDDGALYEADILQINKSNYTCVIRYCGYEDEEEKGLDELIPVNESQAQPEQKPSVAFGPKMHSSVCTSCGCPPGPGAAQSPQSIFPPPTVQPSNMLPVFQAPGSGSSSSSTLHCALMSWYMAGFHTGYHQAVMDLRSGNSTKQGHDQIPSCPPMPQQCHGHANSCNRNATKKPSPV